MSDVLRDVLWQRPNIMSLTSCERTAAAENHVGEKTLPEVKICLVDRVDDDLMDSRVLQSYQLGIEKDLRGPESFRAELR